VYYSVLQCVAVRLSRRNSKHSHNDTCDAVCCSVLQCVAVCCSVLQYGAVCCSVSQCVAVMLPLRNLRQSRNGSHSQNTATLCNTLQHTATHCNNHDTHNNSFVRIWDLFTKAILHSELSSCSTLQHTATHCNTLQHNAQHCTTLHHSTYCTTLQHTATHCNTHAILFVTKF